MPTARKNQVSLVDTKYYHCISRCVRRAFLCGKDKFTGRSYEHRREWVEEKLLTLATVFCIDICAYAVMSNHTHIVLYVDDKKAKRLSDKAIVIRWHKLFKGNWLTHKFIEGSELNHSELIMLNGIIEQYRERLASISWFMRVLNEDIARRANKEDGCTGRFWEGRFKSQALLDEAALVACMAYVDLNPIRATVADTPETSDYTSIKKRIEHAHNGKQPKSLLRFAGNPRQSIPKGLPFELKYYIELVELTGRCVRADKRGHICDAQPIIARLQIEPENWLKLTTRFTKVFHGAAGRRHAMTQYCTHLQKKRCANLVNCERLLG
ncbi:MULTISPECIES: transposase [unclassified Pseudoalteromonas]|uniref:transposase n=1 Tax=unclassified Pseudoalteromonas TaxID=194690 RepID=UPI00209861EC|nr:transposase [Pseudoalteromonas sp. XMcav2-N]MCO7191381.1 transposase [Pseudoalteromonas sp. XMcav2-N]